ncbi:uncharacterized protein JN550_002207 [Neoarthrinium moseri]|uniref:uncharacterized protein n=1 Tax=Neoarthrinium moseri TaxID=1658444 RepID=UPI001FDB0D11|nr:uncharacterized protein JN550_002207 [Neoarthrinium moseri]KAI1874778.1 hypothetical protein JN550_002207 [Neoarthrinium moseri]
MRFSIAVALFPVLALATPVVEERQTSKCCYIWEGQNEAYFEVTADGQYLDAIESCYMTFARNTANPSSCEAASRIAYAGYCEQGTKFLVVACRS